MTTEQQEVAPEHRTADEIVGENIHMLLFRKKKTRRDLGRALGLSDQTVGKKINGVTTFTLDELIAVTRVLEVSLTELLPGNDYAPLVGGRGGRGQRLCASRDLNPEPADYAPGQVINLHAWRAPLVTEVPALKLLTPTPEGDRHLRLVGEAS